ncbi:hypothetical protein GOP47_0025397 [Adiantum capillus-veneris]|uniref:TOG domain-containing protein n=1 Tax=Adiantum capillus-veneris TaxID=13818 RepID=A0A9D4Z293_ADICA|nr:hypothetical protein GOP47_0025397 [Adiantum capillus-veneris]
MIGTGSPITRGGGYLWLRELNERAGKRGKGLLKICSPQFLQVRLRGAFEVTIPVMAQIKGTGGNGSGNADGRSKSGSGNKSGGGASTPQLMFIELKQRILCALNKLADRDTQHIAVEDLERIAETLTPEGISLCLSCLYDTDSQQKPTVRKECVRMFGTLASLHDDLLAPHMSKIVINIVKRLRDPDSSIRDACVDAMGTLAAKVSAGSSSGGECTAVTAFSGALGVFAKPLFDVLNEQSRSVQAGAAMCLAGVIDNLKDPPTASLQRLCPRIIKLLNSPTFTAKAALLSVIASIVQAGGTTSYQCLAMVMACVQECLKSTDWATRKAAAETLASMASAVGPSLGTFKSPVLEALEACRFDKVKPVRDMVVQTLQVWKGIPSPDSEQDKTASLKENERMEVPEFQSSKKKMESGKDSATSQKHLANSNSDSEPQDGGCFGFGHSRSAANKIHGDAQRKHAPLADKRSNPPFLNKVEKKDSTNWQIDIALPRALNDSLHRAGNVDVSKQLMAERKIYQDQCSVRRLSNQDLTESGDSSVTASTPLSMLDNQVFEESIGINSMKSQRMTTKQSSCTDLASQIEEAEIGSWSIGAGATSSSSSSVNDSQAMNSESDSAFIRQQLFHIENQQSNILNFLQKLMKKSEESLANLEARIAGVESTVGNLVTDLANITSAKCVKPQTATDLSNPKIWKKNETCGLTQDRPRSSESLLSARGGRLSPLMSSQLSAGASGLNDNRFGTGLSPLVSSLYSEAQANSWRAHVDISSDTLQRRSRTEVDGISFANKNVQDRGPASRLGEGPSARSIWQASKDEATLAAIRVAGEDGRVKLLDSLNNPGGQNPLTAEVKPELSMRKIGGQGKGPFWSLWARAAEFLRSGDVDSAFVEVLCAGDEVLLVRLMSRTGPVLEQLSNGTTQELLRNVLQLMLQQSFLDVILPWVQQVSDLVASNGADCLGLPFDAKRSIVASLEEASTSGFSEKWIATTVHELAVQLASTWGLAHAR